MPIQTHLTFAILVLFLSACTQEPQQTFKTQPIQSTTAQVENETHIHYHYEDESLLDDVDEIAVGAIAGYATAKMLDNSSKKTEVKYVQVPVTTKPKSQGNTYKSSNTVPVKESPKPTTKVDLTKKDSPKPKVENLSNNKFTPASTSSKPSNKLSPPKTYTSSKSSSKR